MADRSRIRYRIHPPSSPLPPAVAAAAASSVLFPQHIQLLVPLPPPAPLAGPTAPNPPLPPPPAPPPPPSHPHPYTLARDLPLTALLSPVLHAANPGLAVLPAAAALDRANTFCVAPSSPPTLRLSLDKDTYVALGLVGDRKLRGDHPVATAGRRYAVDVPLPVKSAKVGARLRWALGRDRLGGCDVVMCAGGGAGVALPPELGADAPGGGTAACPCEVTTVTSAAGPVVDAGRLLRDAASGDGGGDALAELIDWLGVAAAGGVEAAAALLGPPATDGDEGVPPPQVPPPTEPSPFIFDYAAALAAPHALRITTTTGFLHPSAAAAAADVAVATVSAGAAPWAAVTVMGVPDAPLLFRPGGVDRACGPAPAAGSWGGDGGVVVLVVRGGGGVVATLLSGCDM